MTWSNYSKHLDSHQEETGGLCKTAYMLVNLAVKAVQHSAWRDQISSHIIRRILLSERFNAAVCRNAEHRGSRITGCCTLSMCFLANVHFSGFRGKVHISSFIKLLMPLQICVSCTDSTKDIIFSGKLALKLDYASCSNEHRYTKI